MKKVLRLISSLLIIFSVLLFQYCATLTRREKQRIPVTSSPAGARVIVNSTVQGVTPLEIRLARNDKNQVIRIESPGHNPFEIRLKRELAGDGILGNFLFGIAAGYVAAVFYVAKHEEEVDARTKTFTLWGATAAVISGGFTLIDLSGKGKGYTLKPAELKVQLTEVDGTPRVDTLLISEGDFRNIKWIRIHRN